MPLREIPKPERATLLKRVRELPVIRTPGGWTVTAWEDTRGNQYERARKGGYERWFKAVTDEQGEEE